MGFKQRTFIYIWSRERRARAWEGNDRPIVCIFCCHLPCLTQRRHSACGPGSTNTRSSVVLDGRRSVCRTTIPIPPARHHQQQQSFSLFLFQYSLETRHVQAPNFIFDCTAHARNTLHTQRNQKRFSLFSTRDGGGALASRRSGIAFSALFPSTTNPQRTRPVICWVVEHVGVWCWRDVHLFYGSIAKARESTCC